MADTLLQVILKTPNGIAEDYVTNSFCIAGMSSTSGDEAAIALAIKAFYDELDNTLFSDRIAQNGHTIKFYTAGGPQPNYPYEELTFNFGSAPTLDSLPTEVAICLSFQGLRIPGTPQSRRRGRIYLGPVKATLTASARPTSGIRTIIATAATNLAAAIVAVDPTYRWAVWSRTDGVAVAITDGWVDDTWDTQRRRGLDATSRTTFVV